MNFEQRLKEDAYLTDQEKQQILDTLKFKKIMTNPVCQGDKCFIPVDEIQHYKSILEQK